MAETEFRLTPELPNTGQKFLTAEQSKKLVLSPNEVSVSWLLDQVRKTLPQKRLEAREGFFDHGDRIWARAGLEPEKTSLLDLESPEANFDGLTGAIKLPGFKRYRYFAEFYGKPGRVHRNVSGTFNRGPGYYLTTDPMIGTVEQKMAILAEDVADGLKVLKETGIKKLSSEEFLLQLGALDYLKQHSLALYHVLVQPEKEGQVVTPELLEMKEKALILSRYLTRKYYLTLLGRTVDHDHILDGEINTTVAEVSEYILKNLNNRDYFKLAETDHPIRILISAHQAVVQNPDVDVIVALPRGSTQLGIVTELVYQLAQGFSPKLVLIPISLYSKRTRESGEPLEEQFAKYMREAKLNFRRDTVLIVDDNTHSGRTLKTVLDAEGKVDDSEKFNSIMVGELDPIRIENLYAKNRPPAEITNFLNPDILSCALWILPIMRQKRENTYELRKYLARKVLLAGMGEKFIEHRIGQRLLTQRPSFSGS